LHLQIIFIFKFIIQLNFTQMYFLSKKFNQNQLIQNQLLSLQNQTHKDNGRRKLKLQFGITILLKHQNKRYSNLNYH